MGHTANTKKMGGSCLRTWLLFACVAQAAWAATPLSYHGSNGNGDTTAQDIGSLGKSAELNDGFARKASFELENATMNAHFKQQVKNEVERQYIKHEFPDGFQKGDEKKEGKLTDTIAVSVEKKEAKSVAKAKAAPSKGKCSCKGGSHLGL